jgi:hypothetical protein
MLKKKVPLFQGPFENKKELEVCAPSLVRRAGSMEGDDIWATFGLGQACKDGEDHPTLPKNLRQTDWKSN